MDKAIRLENVLSILRGVNKLSEKGRFTREKTFETLMQRMEDLSFIDLEQNNGDAPVAFIKDWKPVIPYGQIYRTIWRCGHCQKEIDRKDRYCRFCGTQLLDEEVMAEYPEEVVLS